MTEAEVEFLKFYPMYVDGYVEGASIPIGWSNRMVNAGLMQVSGNFAARITERGRKLLGAS